VSGSDDETRPEELPDAELRELVLRLDRLVPREGAHLTVSADPHGSTAVGSRLGYLRLGVELLTAGLDPLPASDRAPARIEPALDYLLTEGSKAPLGLCEIDEAIVARPPVRSPLGAVGQLAAVVIAVGALIAFAVVALVALRWLFR
jgi:hypothetical protein